MAIQFTPEEILKSFEGIKRAEPSPFLYTRIQAKMDREETSIFASFLRLVASPTIALGITFLFLLINVMILMYSFKENTPRDDYSLSIAREYHVQTLNPYETPIEAP